MRMGRKKKSKGFRLKSSVKCLPRVQVVFHLSEIPVPMSCQCRSPANSRPIFSHSRYRSILILSKYESTMTTVCHPKDSSIKARLQTTCISPSPPSVFLHLRDLRTKIKPSNLPLRLGLSRPVAPDTPVPFAFGRPLNRVRSV